MLEKLNAIENRYNELNRLIEENAENYSKVAELAKERAELEPFYVHISTFRSLTNQLEQAQQLADSGDPDMAALAAVELQELPPQIEKIERELRTMLLPRDPRDDNNVYIEIRAGAGGDEAGLFAAELMRMYILYAEARNWTVEMVSSNETGIGGFKEVIFMVRGKGAYSKFKYESGVHRVQRIPATESSGRIHTSTTTVAVMAEVEDIELQIPENDLEIEVYRSSGAGGQNVQKNSTAVRITHKPTGMVVACQDERSQLQNKLRALGILKARLYEMEQEKAHQERDAARRSQVGTGDRSEKIRTYNFPQSRVTDHRINVSSHNITSVMNGNLDQFIDELSLRDETERLAASNGDDD